jgi:DNA repair protein RecO (recombination protein O)
MQVKTQGIVLHQIKYSETSIIATLYTRSHGRITILVQGARKKRAKIRASLFQHLFLLDLEMYYKDTRNLQKLKEASIDIPFREIPYDYRKRTIALFLAEVLYKTLHEEESNPFLFDFIYNHIKILDLKENGLSHFHINFLIQLTKHLGFFPENNYNATNSYFDLKKGQFVGLKPSHDNFLPEEESRYFSKLMDYSSNQHAELTLNRKLRNKLLEAILEFYYMHAPEISKIKSYDVLKETLE